MPPEKREMLFAMTFEEIARELGVSRAAVCYTYLRAMNKLRRHPVLLEKIRETVETQRRLREFRG